MATNADSDSDVLVSRPAMDRWVRLLYPVYPHTRVNKTFVCSAYVQPFSTYDTLVWTQSNSSPKSPTMSSSESSLLEGQTQARRRFCKEFAIPPRVQRSTGLVHRESASGYDLILSGDSISSSSQVQLEASQEVGQAYSCR
jgi:hypothetical protein